MNRKATTKKKIFNAKKLVKNTKIQKEDARSPRPNTETTGQVDQVPSLSEKAKLRLIPYKIFKKMRMHSFWNEKSEKFSFGMKSLKNSCSRNFSHHPKMGIFQKNLCKSGLQPDLLNSVASSSHLIFTTTPRQHYSNLPQWENTFERGQLTGTTTHQKTLTPCFGDGASSKFPGDAVGPQVTFWGGTAVECNQGCQQ